MRLSDAERELLYDKLGDHAAAGRIGVEELERRVAAIEAAESREEAARVLADLPPIPTASARRRRLRRDRGHGHADAPEPDWHPTDERFRDPKTNRVIRVWVDSAGGRHYVADDET
jgi:hypothetical protein